MWGKDLKYFCVWIDRHFATVKFPFAALTRHGIAGRRSLPDAEADPYPRMGYMILTCIRPMYVPLTEDS